MDRYRLDGSSIGSDGIGRWTGFGVVSARSGSRLFLWDAQAHTLVRYDLTTGTSERLTVPGTGDVGGPDDPVGALGRALGAWLAPTAQAKAVLQPAIALSPDGRTLYALGIGAGPLEASGSAGVFAFDIGDGRLSLKSHWEPTADYISLAVSEDGAFVYAAGMGGVDAQGNESASRPSVTVFDATDGSVRLFAGQLAGNELLFVEPIVR